MSKRIHIKIAEDKRDILREYSKKNNISMKDAIENVIVYIAARDIHPSEFFLDSNTNAFNAEERIIREIKKNRDTYVSFQRTYEVLFNSYAEYSKTLQLYNSKRLLESVVHEKDYDRFLVSLVSSLITIEVSFLLIKQKIDGNKVNLEELPEMAKIMAGKLLELKNVSPGSITEAAKHITKTYK